MRKTLSIPNPRLNAVLAGLDIDEGDRRFGNRLLASVDRWQVGRNLISAPVRLSKADADRKLRSMLRSQMIGRAADV